MNCFIFVTHYLNIFRIHEKHSNTFSIACRLNLNYNNKELLPKRVFERRRKDNLLQKTDCLQNQIRSKSICHAAKIHNILRTCFNVINKKCIYPSGEAKRRHPSQDTFFTGRQHPSLPKLPKRFFINRFYITTRRPGSLFLLGYLALKASRACAAEAPIGKCIYNHTIHSCLSIKSNGCIITFFVQKIFQTFCICFQTEATAYYAIIFQSIST